jgi:uncharacterized protein YjbJ (UPF0337 family)
MWYMAETALNEVQGKIKAIAGKLVNNPKLEAESSGETASSRSSGKNRPGQEGFGEGVDAAHHAPTCHCAHGFGSMTHHNQAPERHEAPE